MNWLNLRSTHFSVRFPKPKNRKQLTDPSLIKALDLDVELIKIDMYQKFEHRRPWFIKVSRRNFENYLYRLIEVKSSDDQVLKSFRWH